ncbi:hypothetical protein TNCV_4771121 [Trichonephila clavipes]|nr:hypothetical protein TNCV_4771121 [Trichonephila clavipes]
MCSKLQPEVVWHTLRVYSTKVATSSIIGSPKTFHSVPSIERLTEKGEGGEVDDLGLLHLYLDDGRVLVVVLKERGRLVKPPNDADAEEERPEEAPSIRPCQGDVTDSIHHGDCEHLPRILPHAAQLPTRHSPRCFLNA